MIYRQTLATALLLAVIGTPAVAQTAAKKLAAAPQPQPPPNAGGTWYRRRSSTLSSRERMAGPAGLA